MWPHEDLKEFRISDPRTNDRIRVPEVRLVGPNGEQIGVVAIDVALRLAQEADLDLVEVAPNSRPPVAKIMDYGKFKYEEAQKAKEARRNQANTILKEVRFRLKIDVHDYETKRKRAEGFLAAGDKVKAMILFRGREQSRPDQGVRLLQRFAEDVSEFGTVESSPTIDGRNMVMVIGPHKTKAAAKAEADARRAANKPAKVAPAPAPVAAAAAEDAEPAAVPVEALVAEPLAEKAPEIKAVVPKVDTPKAVVPKAVAPKSAASPAAAVAAAAKAVPKKVVSAEAVAAAEPINEAPQKEEENA